VVRIQRVDTSAFLPVSQRLFALSRGEEHLFVIAFNQDDLAATLQFDQLVQDSGAIAALVNEVSEEHQLIGSRGRNRFQQRLQSMNTTVNVSDCDQSW
jgi:hypothetical protein